MFSRYAAGGDTWTSGRRQHDRIMSHWGLCLLLDCAIRCTRTETGNKSLSMYLYTTTSAMSHQEISGRVSTAARCPGDVPPRRHSTPEYIMYMRVFDLTLHEQLTDLTMPCSPRETSRPQSTHIPRVSGSRHLLSRRLRRATGIKHAVLVRLSTTFVRVLARH